MEKSLFGNQQTSAKNFRENEEFPGSQNSNYLSKPNLNDLESRD